MIEALGSTKPISNMKIALNKIKKYFIDNDITEINWRQLSTQNPETQSMCASVKPILDKVRHGNPNLTLDTINKAIEQYTKEYSDYTMSYGIWDENEGKNPHAMDVSYRKIAERVLRINQAGSLKAEIEKDTIVRNWFQNSYMSSKLSGHPVEQDTVGWLRIDEINKDYLLIDEIQGDVINAIFQAKTYVDPEIDTWEKFKAAIGDNPQYWEAFKDMGFAELAKHNPHFRHVTKHTDLDEAGPALWSGQREGMARAGLNLTSLEHIKKVLSHKFREWVEVGLNTLLHLAKEEGIGMVLLNTEEVFKERDSSFTSKKYFMYYEKLAKKYGFEEVTINTPEISGTFLGRKP